MLTLTRRNLLRNKKRTVLTMGSVAIGVLLLCLLLAMLASMERAEGSADNRVVIRSKISLAFELPESYWERAKTLPHTLAVTPLSWYQGVFIDNRPENFFPRFACDPATLFDVFREIELPDAERTTWLAERDSFVAGKSLVDRFGWKIGDRIAVKGDIYPVNVDLVLRGVFTVPQTPSMERQIFFHRKYLEEGLGNPGNVGTYWLLVESPDDVPAVVTAAESMFENSEMPVRAETEKAFQLSFLEMMGNVRVLFGAIGLAVVISIFFITANTMAMTARERTNEVAVLKTLGYRRRHVVGLVLGESVAVGLAGACAGTVLAAGLLALVASALAESFPFFGTLSVTPAVAAVSVLAGLAVGVLAGWFPAAQVARLRIVDGLRRVA
jgi:putative ABC transport system permease protein